MIKVSVAAALIVPPLKTMVAVPLETVEVYVKLFVVVVPLLVAPKVIVLPSTTIDSFAPSAKPLTVKVRPVIVCPVSMVLALAELKTFTAAPCTPKPEPSVKVGFNAVAVKVGASLTETTVTADAILKVLVSEPPFAVPPLSLICVKVKVRVPAVG